VLISLGVMRFLQIEWHNHERARNAWDIERAEMKSKIAKQEGEIRHTKKLSDQLERQIRMLELALKNERAKSRSQAVNETSDESREGHREDAQAKASKGEERLGVKPTKRRFHRLDTDAQLTKVYSRKCASQLIPPNIRVGGSIYRREGAISGQVKEISREMHAGDTILTLTTTTPSSTTNEHPEWSLHRTSGSTAYFRRCVRPSHIRKSASARTCYSATIHAT